MPRLPHRLTSGSLPSNGRNPRGRHAKETRFFADGAFFTPDRRARFVATPFKALQPNAAPTEFPLVLNTGRVRDQWHTMTRTAKTPRLMAHIAEPFVEVHPADAERDGLMAAGLATVRSAHGTAIVRVQVSDRQQRGSVFVPMHWTDQLASSARIDALVQADVDPVSGQPGLKQTHVAVEAYAATWFGFVVASARPHVADADYWALSPAKSGWRAEIAGCTPVDDFAGLARNWLGLAAGDGHEMLSYFDQATGSCRFAAFQGERLVGAVFIAREPVAVSRSWAADQLDADLQAPADRLRLLAGRPGAAARDRGAIVCACFEVGQNDISEAITTGGCATVDAVGQALKAGTNCGSCRSEIGRMIREDEAPDQHLGAKKRV